VWLAGKRVPRETLEWACNGRRDAVLVGASAHTHTRDCTPTGKTRTAVGWLGPGGPWDGQPSPFLGAWPQGSTDAVCLVPEGSPEPGGSIASWDEHDGTGWNRVAQAASIPSHQSASGEGAAGQRVQSSSASILPTALHRNPASCNPKVAIFILCTSSSLNCCVAALSLC
jgi:hypothetical protein